MGCFKIPRVCETTWFFIGWIRIGCETMIGHVVMSYVIPMFDIKCSISCAIKSRAIGNETCQKIEVSCTSFPMNENATKNVCEHPWELMKGRIRLIASTMVNEEWYCSPNITDLLTGERCPYNEVLIVACWSMICSVAEHAATNSEPCVDVSTVFCFLL